MQKKIITVELEDGSKIQVVKLKLGKYAELLRGIKEFSGIVEKINGVSNEEIIGLLPDLIASFLPDAKALLAIATPATPEQIEEIGLSEAVDLVAAIIEVNNYQGVFEKIKKMLATQKIAVSQALEANQRKIG